MFIPLPHRSPAPPAEAEAPPPRRPQRGSAAPLPLLLALPLALALTPGAAQAQSGTEQAEAAEATIIALHYQDLLASEAPFVDLFIPPPPVEGWNELSYTSEGCLSVKEVLTGPPDKAIVLRLQLLAEGNCSTRVDLVFSRGDESWPAAALVVANRLPDVPELDEGRPTFRATSVKVDPFDPLAPRADMFQIGFHNPLAVPMTILGLGNDEAFADVMGSVFRFDPERFRGTYADLLVNGTPFEPTTLAPGDSATFGLVVDPAARLPTGVATFTVRPVVLVEIEGQLYTVALWRTSGARGTELP